MAELIDLYDENRQPLGISIERGQQIPDNAHFLIVHLCLINTSGQLLCQKRHPDKQMGNYWDVTCGGGVISSEDSQTAMSRELNEELGLNIDFTNYQPMFTLKTPYAFDDYYFLLADVDVDMLLLQESEVIDAKYMSFSEIEELIEADQFIPYSHYSLIKDIAEKLLAYYNENK